MKYLLDTNVCIRCLRKSHPKMRQELASRSPSDIYLSTVVLSELYRGTLRSTNPSAERSKVDAFVAPFAILPFDTAAAGVHANIRVDLERRGLVIGPYDGMIAAIAIANDLTLITHNTAEFARVSILSIEDWELP